MFAVGFLLLRFVPEGNLIVDGGGWAPNRSNLLEVFVRYAWWALALLVVFGLARRLGARRVGAADPSNGSRMPHAGPRDGSLDHRIDLPGAVTS